MISRQWSILLRASRLVTVAVALVAVMPARAGSEFDEVIVTAQKREQGIYDAPVAITAFSEATLLKQGIADLTDLGKFVPNMNVTGYGAGQTSSVNAFIRGIGLQDHLITTDPGVGVYVDGVYLGRQVGQNWSLANIERVEVLRGPQGTLYGRNSIGGAINLITRKPGADDGGKVSLLAGSRGRFNAEVYADQRLSEQWAVSLSGAFQRRDGLGRFLLLSHPGKQVGQLQDASGRLAVLWTPSARWSVLLTADASQGDNGLRPYDTLIDEVPTGALYRAGYRNADGAANPYDNNTGQAGQVAVTNHAQGLAVTLDYEISAHLKTKLLLSDRQSRYTAGLDDDGFFADFLSFPEVGEAHQTSVEWQWTGATGAWDYLAGLYRFTEQGKNVQAAYTFNGSPGSFQLNQNTTSQAGFVHLGYTPVPRLRLSGGLRRTRDDKTAGVNIGHGLIDEQASRRWSQTSWELSAAFRVGEQMSVYGTVQNGYQSGQFPPRPFCLFAALDLTQPGHVRRPNCFTAGDNVTARNHEIGLKGQPLEHLQLSVAVFHTRYSHLPYQLNTTTANGFDTRNVVVDQVSRGIEWESTWQVTEGFRLYSTLGYLEAQVNDPMAVAPLTPRLTASISPEWTLHTAQGGEVTLRADGSYRSKMHGEPVAAANRFTTMASRSLVNVDLGYQPPGARWSVSAYGRNLTDRRYDNARLNTGDYVVVMLSNDASEFGVRFTQQF